MKVVIDTNVLVSAVLKNRDPESVILFVFEQDDFEWIVSQEILTTTFAGVVKAFHGGDTNRQIQNILSASPSARQSAYICGAQSRR